MTSEFENVHLLLEDPDKIKKRIYRVGIELEGGWNKAPEGCKIDHDGSVIIQIPATCLEDIYSPAQVKSANTNGLFLEWKGHFKNILTGEIPSMVLAPGDFPTWMTKYYPNYVNDTCGLHVHMSFTSAMHYQKLMTPVYTQKIIEHITKWAKAEGLPKSHPIWSRLSGKSRFCQNKFYGDEQVRKTGKDYNREAHGNRYTMVNYCFNLHNTLEVRLLPMFEGSEQAIRAVHAILDITNACLASSVMGRERKRVRVEGGIEKIIRERTRDGERIVEAGNNIYRERRRLEI